MTNIDIDRFTLQEMHDGGLPDPEKLVVVSDGTIVTVISSQGAIDVPCPVYGLEDRALRIEEKDIDIVDDKPSISHDLKFAVIDQGVNLK